MDMKKILQAMDGIATRPVEGADSMAKFLRVVKEAEINQPQAPVAPAKPAAAQVKVPEIPPLPAQDGDQGNGEVVKTNADGTRTYSGAFGTFIYDAQGKAVTYTSPNVGGYGQTINLTNNQTTQNYNTGPLNISRTNDANGKQVAADTSYDLGVAKLRQQTNATGQTTNTAYVPYGDATHVVQENSLSKFLSIVDKNNVSMLSEGANPHKVTLPVQMAMQHYQQPKETLQPRERLIDKYFVEAETEIMQRREEKRALINQYAKTIAERVLMKESVQGVPEGDVPADPNKLTASMLMGGEYKEFDLTPTMEKNNWVGTPRQVIEQADKWLSNFLRQRGAMYSNLKLRYKGMTMNSSKIGDIDASDLEFESMVEAPIEMDPSEPNNPRIYGHEKANAMSLKGRIASARAQLQELAQLAESNELVVWEKITRLSKGGMFMGLEQNLEQIRHGISELATQRRKGGTASRGIDKHIGEGKRK